jgi:HTH-type transcriptional regulator / antitoxin HigA
MQTTEQYKTPGQLVDALLRERGWTQALLSAILGKDTTTINKLVSDKSAVSAEFAVLLEEAFSVPAEKFLELQKSFDLAKARYSLTPDPKRTSRAKLLSDLPVTEMIGRGWIKVGNTKDVTEIEAALGNFFGVEKNSDVELISYAAKKTNVLDTISPLQLAWLYRVSSIAQQMLVKPFLKSKIPDLIAQLKPLLIAPQEARKVPKLFAEYGIRLVFVEALKSSKIDGVCTWLNEKNPVIGLSLRYDRLDNFWFVLRHELEHVMQGHGLFTPHLDSDMGSEETKNAIDEQEAEANDAAAHFSIPKGKLDSFIARKSPLFQERDFLGFAKLLGIHPSIVAGQIRHKTQRFELFNSHNSKIREHVLPSAISDGWGTVVPVPI